MTPGCWNGRQASLKNWWPQGREGSTPSPGTFRWSKNLAYAVGLITTDGNLSIDKRYIQFTTTDYELARIFKKSLGIKNRIVRSKPSGFGKKLVYRINFGNVKLYRGLEQIGLKVRKTHSLGALIIPNNYFADFLRGHLDGDGSVFTYIDKYMSYKGRRYVYDRLYTAFNSSSAKHLKWIRSRIRKILEIKGCLSSYLKKNRRFTMWQLRFAKKDSLKLLSWLYYQPEIPSLSRKRRIFERFQKNLLKKS